MAKTTHSRPSDLLCIADRLTAFQLDAAVSLFQGIVENALQEMVEVGSNKIRPRYTLRQLLTDGFRLQGQDQGLALLQGNIDGGSYDEVTT